MTTIFDQLLKAHRDELLAENERLKEIIGDVQLACDEALADIPLPGADFRRGYNTMARVVTGLLGMKR